MKTSIGLDIFDTGADFNAVADHVAAAERIGVDTVWSAEAWGTDAFVPLAYLAARTGRIRLATGIAQISARAPMMTAMTAMTLDSLSHGRFVLGLGVSGPQVVEGLHGQRYERPLERLTETVEVLRMAFRGEKVSYNGASIVLPLPGGQGKPIRLMVGPRPLLPIHLATLGPRSLRLTGAVADGWVGTCFVPERADHYLAALAEGAVSAGRTMADLEIEAGGPVVFSDDLERPLHGRKKALAFQLSAMGSPTTNFYNDAYARLGYADAAREVRDIWLSGDRDRAVAAVPDELAISTSLMGDDEQVRARIRAYKSAGVTNLRVDPIGRTASDKLDVLERVVDLVRQVDAET